MEAETALVRAERGVELHTVAQVRADLALVVDPGDAEGEDAVGLHEALDDLSLLELGVLVVDVLDGLEDLADSLEVLLLPGVLGLQLSNDLSDFHDELCGRLTEWKTGKILSSLN